MIDVEGLQEEMKRRENGRMSEGGREKRAATMQHDARCMSHQKEAKIKVPSVAVVVHCVGTEE